MEIDNVINALNPEIIARLKGAVETGKWPDGRRLTPQQTATCMQAIIAYEHRHLEPHERSGYVPPKDGACGPKDDVQKIQWQ